MTHPFIEVSLKYKRAQAIVLREAESFVAAGDARALRDAVLEMQRSRVEYLELKAKVSAESQES